MCKTTEKEESQDFLQQDPLLALELCKKWITRKFNFPEEEIFLPKNEPKYLSVKQWASKYGYIPEGGIRHLIFSNAEFNKRVVKRVGKKILLDIVELEKWISEQNNQHASVSSNA